MKPNTKLILAVLVASALSPMARAGDQGLDGNAVYTWLKSAGYVTEQTPAEVTAHRSQVLAGSTGGGGGSTTQPSDAAVNAIVDRTTKTFPDFDKYPPYVQDSLLLGVAHGEFAPNGTEPASQDIRAGDWTSATTDYPKQPGYSKTTEDAFIRYAKDREVEQTWARAAVVGDSSFGLSPVSTTSANAANKNLKTLVANDQDNRQLRANPITSSPVATFQFNVNGSSGGFTDITVPANHSFKFNVRDRNIVDGDIEVIHFVNAAGTSINKTITLTSAGNDFSVKALHGANELEIFAVNQGTLGLNSGGIDIKSTVLNGAMNQNVGLTTGQTAIMRITGR